MKRLITAFLYLLTINAFAQTNYGNEWIKGNQKYAKVKVTEDGVYRISYTQLQATGLLSDNPDASKFQIFHQGKEIPIYIEGEADGKIDAADFIEFYGKKNDGKLDQQLYANVSLQPNPEVSLFSDDGFYFVTVGASNGKRYTNTTLTRAGLSTEQFVVYTSSANFAEAYYPGSYLIDVMSLSEYQEGEGYLGNTLSLGSTQTRNLHTPSVYASGSFTPTLSFYVAGRSAASSTSNTGMNHHLRVSIGGTTLHDTQFSNYSVVRQTVNVASNLLTENTSVNFSSVDDIGARTDYQAVGYARITYARNLDGANINYFSFKLQSENTNALLTFTNTSWPTAVVLDEENQLRYIGDQTGNTTSFVVKNLSSAKFALASSFKTATVENVSFNIVNGGNINAKLLIVTHKTLLESANEYAAYKQSKGFPSLVVTTDEIYNQFFYGQHHPLAIKYLVKYLLNTTTTKPEYLLLLGKGYETPKANINNDLVPTMGFPASDSYLTSEILDNTMTPALATGRVPAKNNDEVRIYLNKVKNYDLQENALWRKNIINITGGNNSSEDYSFSNYLKNLTNIAANGQLGANPINYYKSVTDPITDNLAAKISNDINNGVGILNFLGHGSTTNTAASIGNPFYLNNGSKLLSYIINGCSTGNAFVNGSLGEDYILAPNKGAITWIGTTSEGIASYLFNFTRLLFENSFNSNYGKSIAQNLALASRTFQQANDQLNRAHTRQYILLGDPTVTLYAPSQPDYEIKNEDIGFTDTNLSANSPTVKMFAIVRNNGKATNNNVPVQVKRTMPDNSVLDYPVNNFTKISAVDTVHFDLDNNLANIAGNNKFTFTIDPANTIVEANKTNNKAEVVKLLQADGIMILSPSNFSVVKNSDVELSIQATDIFASNKSYLFEIDTLSTFNSSWKKVSQTISANAIASWKPNLQLENNRVYYWRAKQVVAGTTDIWQTSSFTYNTDSDYNWSQSHYQQLSNTTLHNVIFNNQNKNFEFAATSFPVLIRTKGNNAPIGAERRIRTGINVASIAFSPFEFEGFTLAAFHPTKSSQLYNYASAYNFKNDGVNGVGQFLFNTNYAADLAAMREYLINLPNDYYVVGSSGKYFDPLQLPADIMEMLQDLGLTKITTINEGEPYAFWTQKGNNKKITPLELTADYTSPTNPKEQIIDFSYDLIYPWNNGSVTSEKIGPALSWSSADIKLVEKTNDILKFNVIGIDNTGIETTLKTNLTSSNISLNDIDANRYPYLKLAVNATDDVDNTMANFKHWSVAFQPYADLSFNAAHKNDFYAKTIQQGDSVKVAIGVTNLSQSISDEFILNYKITKADRTVLTGTSATLPPIAFNNNAIANFKYPTKTLNGSTILQLQLVPKNGKDMQDFNNYALYNFDVTRDFKEPILDVFFDNKKILAGEIISPTPHISIHITDENRYMLLTDTNSIEVFIKEENDLNFKRVPFSSNKLIVSSVGNSNNNKIEFAYKPDALADGRYTLKLKAKDASGNYNTMQDYTIDFEVVNEETITNFLPYPNPFTTAMKFVFQITGKVPDKIKVQIMTVNGKIVKEVFKEELGNLRVGNNISDFTWDGTDQFGDRLANGVYFYNVIIENNDKTTTKHRSNNSDVFFKKNFGKIYLMR